MVDSVQPGVSDGGAAGEPDGRTARTDGRPASLAVVELLASLADLDPLELAPLYDSVDPDALDALVDSLGSSGGAVTFTHAGYAVTVRANGTVTAASRGE